MKRLPAADELRDEVWNALVKFKGDRVKAAKFLDKSLRTINRYIHDLNLYEDMDKAGMMRGVGPPRGEERGVSERTPKIVAHIKKNHGEIDYSDLAAEMYGEASKVTLQRVYSALNELKMKGIIAIDGQRWFVL